MFELMIEIKQCQICNSTSADDEVQIMLTKKIAKTTRFKEVSIPCCHNCKELISRQNKRVWKVRWTIFFIFLVILVGTVLVFYMTSNTDMLVLWLVFSALCALALSEFVYSLFFSSRHEKIERQECEAAEMQYIGDLPEVQEYLRKGYRIQHMN